MLKKLLKYDFQSVFKYWWIAALTSFVLSIAGGGCTSLLTTEKDLPTAVFILAVLGLSLVVISYVAFSLITMILVFTRFYKNFFTDEGYLTFTLPVKKSQLLNSKLIMSAVTILITDIILLIDIFAVILIGFFDQIFTKSFWQGISHLINELSTALGGYLFVYILELLILIVLFTILSCLFLFACITFASIITKKAKILTAIGIYYVVNGICSFILQILLMFGITSFSNWLLKLPESSIQPVIALVLMGILLFITLFAVMLYTLEYWMIDRKLNLN